MQLKDYIHYYYGCEFIANGMRYTIDRIDRLIKGTRQNPYGREVWNDFEPHRIKLVLRRLEDMTEEERVEIFGTDTHWYKPFDATDACDSRQWHKLLSKHFDLFSLIPANLAIDIKSINP